MRDCASWSGKRTFPTQRFVDAAIDSLGPIGDLTKTRGVNSEDVVQATVDASILRRPDWTDESDGLSAWRYLLTGN